MEPQDPGLLFINYTELPPKGSKRVSTDLRAHVMQTYIHKRQYNAEGKLVNCASNRNQKQGSARRQKQEQIKQARSSSQNKDIVDPTPSTDLIRLPLLRNLDVPPTLPVQGPDVQELIQWRFNSQPTIQSKYWEIDSPALQTMFDKNKQGLWDMALEDVGLFHVLLCLAESSRAARTGSKDYVNYLHHKGEAIKAAKLKAKGDDEAFDDNAVALATGLAGLALVDDGPEACFVHTQAITQIMEHDNSISRLGSLSFQTIIWHDLRSAWHSHRRPLIPFSPRNFWASLPASLTSEAHRLVLITVPLLPTLPINPVLGYGPGTCYLLINKVHQICLIYDMKDKPSMEATVSLENHFYWISYHLCVMVGERYAQGQDHLAQMEFTPGMAVILTTQLFMLSCLPVHMHVKPFSSDVYKRGVISGRARYRVCKYLLQPEDIISVWLAHAPLESLLWILTVALEWTRRAVLSADGDVNAVLQLPELSRILRNVVGILGVEDVTGFERVLRMFPWTTFFSEGARDGVWDLLEPT